MRFLRPLVNGAVAAVIGVGVAGCDDLIGLERPFTVGLDAASDGARSAEVGSDGGGRACSPLPASKLDLERMTLLRLTAVVTHLDAGSNGVSCSWIDRTEVTVSDYTEWLEKDPSPAWDATLCAWKGPSATPAQPSASCPIPADEQNPYDPSLPIRCIDWCDASAFCSYYGERLCWSGNNGTQVGTYPDLPEPDEWGGACSGLEDNLFPYGNTYEVQACRIGTNGDCLSPPNDGCGPLAPDTYPDCISPVGALDMIGNVREWINPLRLARRHPLLRRAWRRLG
jgi:hypothetical protein